MLNITYSDFIATVQANAGEDLITSGGNALFQVGTDKNGVVFTPLSTNNPRPVKADDIQRYLDVFNKTQSTTTTDYTDSFYNKSYVIAVIKLWIGQLPDPPLIDDGTSTSGNIDEEYSAPEGDIKVRSHRHRERSRELVQMAKQIFQEKHGKLFCEVCAFDFGVTYGVPDFIEAHHRIPLCELESGTKTKISDLAMVCANCHRMLHRGNPWPTIDALKLKIEAAKSK
jgi:predicted HNH restriction endonuclease